MGTIQIPSNEIIENSSLVITDDKVTLHCGIVSNVLMDLNENHNIKAKIVAAVRELEYEIIAILLNARALSTCGQCRKTILLSNFLHDSDPETCFYCHEEGKYKAEVMGEYNSTRGLTLKPTRI